RVHLTLAPPPSAGANYLILGSDTREFVNNPGEAAAFGNQDAGCNCSDTLMVAHIEPGAKRALVVSFPRDLIVNIPRHGKDRINAAYVLGSSQEVIDHLKLNFGIDINHYVQVDFQSFQAVVDAIGKINVSLPGELYDDYTSFHMGTTGGGCYALDGGAA